MPHTWEYKTCILHKCINKHFQLEKENVWDTIQINVAMCLNNSSSRGANENKRLYPHTTAVNRPSPSKHLTKHLKRLQSSHLNMYWYYMYWQGYLPILYFKHKIYSITKQIEKNKLDTISLRATRTSSVRLAPKIPNYVIHDFDYDFIRSKSSRGIIFASLTYNKVIFLKKLCFKISRPY